MLWWGANNQKMPRDNRLTAKINKILILKLIKMKRKAILILASLGLLLLNFFPIVKLRAEDSNSKKHWQQMTCSDGVTKYEICSDQGDGARCFNGGATTRKCPGETD